MPRAKGKGKPKTSTNTASSSSSIPTTSIQIRSTKRMPFYKHPTYKLPDTFEREVEFLEYCFGLYKESNNNDLYTTNNTSQIKYQTGPFPVKHHQISYNTIYKPSQLACFICGDLSESHMFYYMPFVFCPWYPVCEKCQGKK